MRGSLVLASMAMAGDESVTVILGAEQRHLIDLLFVRGVEERIGSRRWRS